MSLNRKNLALATALVFLAAPAFAQGLRPLELFAQPDLSTFGGGPPPNEGYFFSFEGLEWSISAPEVATIGRGDLFPVVTYVPTGGFPTGTLGPPFPNTTVEASSHTTDFLQSEFTGGERYELGYVSGHHGWLFSGLRLEDQNQRLVASDVHVVFNDPPIGPPIPATPPIVSRLQGYAFAPSATPPPYTPASPTVNLPVVFAELNAQNKVEMWGVELNYTYRMHPNHYGGMFEWLLGVRYLEFDNEFNVDALGDPGDPDAAVKYILADSYWYTEAENHIVGPQIGVRWFRKQNRWTWSTEGRFFAGFNSQSVHQRAALASQLVNTPPNAGIPLKMAPTNSQGGRNFNEWSPAGELRVDLKYQLTRAISLRAGWTGLWMEGIARASNMIDYTLGNPGAPAMGILPANNRQGVFVNGVAFGIELNR